MERKINEWCEQYESFAISALMRVIETTGSIDSDDFYICTGIRIGKRETGKTDDYAL